MHRFLRENSLLIVMFSCFLIFLVIQSITGFYAYNEEQHAHQQPMLDYVAYLTRGNFPEAVFENWESEFLQMGAYVLLTAFLIQKGSSESRSPEGEPELDADPNEARNNSDAPWPVHKGGAILWLYQNSLTIALFSLFLGSFLLHAITGAHAYCHEQHMHAESCPSGLAYMGTPQFWFESMQNWQSEFFSMGLMILFTIFLRQRGSPESKPVASPHSATGRS